MSSPGHARPGTGQHGAEQGCAGDSHKQPRRAGAAHFHNAPAHQPCPSRELTHHSPVSTSSTISTSSTMKPMPHYRQIFPLCKCRREVLLSPGEPRNGRRGVRIGTATHRRAARSAWGMGGQRLYGRASPVASPQDRTRAMWSSATVGPGRPPSAEGATGGVETQSPAPRAGRRLGPQLRREARASAPRSGTGSCRWATVTGTS